MKENIGDAILARVEKRITDVSENLSKRFKNVKPFDSVKMKPEEQIRAWDEFNQDPTAQEQMNVFIQKYGPERVNSFIQEMSELKFKKGIF